MTSELPIELKGIGAGLTTNEASVREFEQSTGVPVTEKESLLKVSCELSGLVMMHWKQKLTVYPSEFVSKAESENGSDPITTFV